MITITSNLLDIVTDIRISHDHYHKSESTRETFCLPNLISSSLELNGKASLSISSDAVLTEASKYTDRSET